MTKRQIKSAASHHSDLNIMAALIAILEGGCVYTESASKTSERIIKLCKEEIQRQLRAYDKACAVLSVNSDKEPTK